ncbi:MAG: toluene monooxygenase [Actinomycetota bacterium]|nr:toluene monooxygenase [Actinomycetota bacterium]
MALIPLASHFDGDFVLKLLPVDTENTFDQVAAAASENAIGVHVAEQPGRTIRVRKQGDADPFPREMTVAASGLEPTECIELFYE